MIARRICSGLFATGLTLFLFPLPIVAQHGGGCACGRYQQQHPTWEIDHTNASFRVAAEAEFDKWHRFVDRWAWATGDGAAGNNGKNEIIFFNPTSTFNQYGITISNDTFGVAYLEPLSAFGSPSFNGCPPPSGTACGTFTETDVIINANFTRGWMTTWPDFDDSVGPANYAATALHELGHALGLHHNFSNLSTMNYFEDFAGIYLSSADAVITRLHYPGEQQSMTDMGTYPFRYSGSGNGYAATTIASASPTTVDQGASFTLRDFTVENPGSSNLSNVRLSLYLSPDSVVSTSDHSLGALLWSSFGSGSWWDTTGWSFAVPDSIPAGTYYIGAIVTYNTSSQDGLTYNNSWVLDASRRLTVRDARGPVTNSVSASPNPTNGATLLTVNAIVEDASRGGSKVAAAELFIDTPGSNGFGYPMFVADGSFDSTTEAVRAVYDISGWTSGTTRTIYVHGKDVSGNWGAFATTSVTVNGGCTYALSPSSQSFGAGGGAGSFSVLTQSGCSWSASTGSGWITMTSGSGSGNGTASFSVAANDAPVARSGTITVAGQTFTVSQVGGSTAIEGARTADFDGDGTSDIVIYRGGAWLYFGPCAHLLNQVGAPLNASCSPCAATVCALDGFCCSSSWDSYCVEEAVTLCQ